jgi:Domain of unknown function (DUF4190)
VTEQPPNYPPPPSGGYGYQPPSPGGYGYPPASPAGYPPPPPSGYGGYGGYGYPPPAYPSGNNTNGLAIASLVTSLVGFFTCGVGSILGLIFGLVALNQIRRTDEGGRGMAVAGIIISSVIFVIFFAFLIIGAISKHNRTDDDNYYSLRAMVVITAEKQQPANLGLISRH